MILENISQLPNYHLAPGTPLYRVQRTPTYQSGAQVSGLSIAPPGALVSRFDLRTDSTIYLALSADTACYEVMCRREALVVSIAQAAMREVVTLHTEVPLTLLDIRGEASMWPVLQSLRYEHTQELAEQALAEGFDGILYSSAQQPGGQCCVLFGRSLPHVAAHARHPLIGADNLLHPAFAEAVRGSCLTVVP